MINLQNSIIEQEQRALGIRGAGVGPGSSRVDICPKKRKLPTEAALNCHQETFHGSAWRALVGAQFKPGALRFYEGQPHFTVTRRAWHLDGLKPGTCRRWSLDLHWIILTGQRRRYARQLRRKLPRFRQIATTCRFDLRFLHWPRLSLRGAHYTTAFREIASR
jgi:hypothetical protein